MYLDLKVTVTLTLTSTLPLKMTLNLDSYLEPCPKPDFYSDLDLDFGPGSYSDIEFYLDPAFKHDLNLEFDLKLRPFPEIYSNLALTVYFTLGSL